MLRSRSRRAVGAKQGGGGGGFMAETTAQSPRHSSSSSSSPTAASVFPSPRPFMAAMALPQAGFLLDGGGTEGPASAVSPTSILETKQFCCSAPLPPFLSERSARRAAHMGAAALEPAGVGLADVLREDGDAKTAAAGGFGAKVVFGSQLRIQVPPASGGRAVELVSSPIEFGAKNRDAVLSPARRFLPEVASVVGSPSARALAAAGVSPVEMAMSEDYTCVISRGPNPRTRHIFDDCIVESCGDALVEVVGDKKPGAVDHDGAAAAAVTSCHACNKKLGDGDDVFIYRGDKAFCSSSECRYQGMMLFDEAVDNLR